MKDLDGLWWKFATEKEKEDKIKETGEAMERALKMYGAIEKRHIDRMAIVGVEFRGDQRDTDITDLLEENKRLKGELSEVNTEIQNLEQIIEDCPVD